MINGQAVAFGATTSMPQYIASDEDFKWFIKEATVEMDKETPMTTCKSCGEPMKAHGYRFCPSCRKAGRTNEHTASSL